MIETTATTATTVNNAETQKSKRKATRTHAQVEKWWERHAATSQPLVEELMALKAQRGVTNTALSHRSGVSVSTLNNWEKQRVRPLMSSVIMVARGLGLRLALVPEN